jgi:hypothetical protein
MMRAPGLARFSQIEKDPWSAVDAVARCRSCADQAEQPLILQRSVRKGFMQPFLEPAARHVEEPAHDSRIKLVMMGLDERVLDSVTLRSTPIAHWSSLVLTITPKVSVKAWEVHSVSVLNTKKPQGLRFIEAVIALEQSR